MTKRQNVFDYSIQVSIETVEKLRKNSTDIGRAKATASNISNIIRAGLVKIKYPKEAESISIKN